MPSFFGRRQFVDPRQQGLEHFGQRFLAWQQDLQADRLEARCWRGQRCSLVGIVDFTGQVRRGGQKLARNLVKVPSPEAFTDQKFVDRGL